MARFVRTMGFAAIALGLTACGGSNTVEEKADKYDGTAGLNLARLVGTTKNPPDEFAVISTDPLQMPDDFAALPPPNPGARSPLVPDPIVEARTVLLGGDGLPQAANARTSVSESALLSATGTSDPNIRSVLAAEQAEYDAEQDLYVLDNVLPVLKRLRSNEIDKDVVVPLEERARLNTATSRPRLGADGIATIPGGTGAVVTPQPVAAQPIATLPTAPAPVPLAAQPTVDPRTGGELIFIPE